MFRTKGLLVKTIRREEEEEEGGRNKYFGL